MAESRKRNPTPRSRKPAKATTIPAPGSEDSDAPTPGFSATSEPPNVLGLEPDTFTAPPGPVPADATVEDEYEPPPPELLEWTPERAGAVVRAGGYLLHTADGMAREPEGTELWRATEADVAAIAPPLSRILNRYAPARRLAGVSDEAELAIGLIGYARTNLATRGRIVTAKRARDELAETSGGDAWPATDQPPPLPES